MLKFVNLLTKKEEQTNVSQVNEHILVSSKAFHIFITKNWLLKRQLSKYHKKQ